MQETNNLPQIYLCDIDGTLSCHKKNRSPYDESKVYSDKTLPTVEIIRSLIKCGHNIVFFSGRTEKCREDSSRWIFDHIGCVPDLHMRHIGDTRNDAIIKKELYELYIKDKYEVLGVYDDRLRVCHMWYDLGLFVFNCNQGLKEF